MTEPVARRRPSKRYPNTGIYKRGSLDPLLDERNRLSPSLVGVAFQISASGLSLIATEHTASGAHPRRVLLEYPAYFDIELPDGREVQIEVREFIDVDRAGRVEETALMPPLDRHHSGLVSGDLLKFIAEPSRGGRTGDAEASDAGADDEV